MDQQVTFLQAIIGSNSTNEDENEGWEEIEVDPTVWARVRQQKGKEVVIADRVTHLQTTVFTINYRADISVLNRIVYREKVYDILSVVENEGSREGFLDVVGELLDNEVWT
jgi:SPP1 family predicted phage head-tail adaptor